MICYKDGGELKRIIIAMISNNLAHDTVAIHEYQELIINYLNKSFEPKKIYYFNNAAMYLFKNKSSFANF